MINLNGNIIQESVGGISFKNRAFKYGDGLFETIKILDNKVVFLEDHYFRLMASLRMLRMEIPMYFNMDFFETEILKTVEKNELVDARVRISIFRNDGGLYKPTSNEISYLIEAEELKIVDNKTYEIDLFKDYYVYSGLLSTVKTSNKLINVLASIYASENDLQNCILLNENKFVAEVINANIFLVFGNVVKTPSLNQGCIKGIVRKKIIEIVSESNVLEIEETKISPFDLQKADEIFITNAIVGIQSVTKYRKATFSTTITLELKEKLENLI
jgi:branched-chain amino acid aminotransferase